jgi:NAD(P)-dependent dehydrogenase (short-subunit alcohol dehydrogenase family)
MTPTFNDIAQKGTNMTDTPIWFITGASSGFGREIAKKVIARGWRAVLTARNEQDVVELTKGVEDRVLTLALDVTDTTQMEAGVAAASARFGRIDVLVNNAGYGYMASAEEGEEDQIRAVFDTNVFGLFAMTRAVLPLMRAHRQGHVINIASVAGFVGLGGSAYYSATKHAVEGFSKALAIEVEPLGLKVTCIEPGPFRTDFAGRSSKTTEVKIDDYAETVGKRIATGQQNSGKQAGDPERAAEAIVAMTAEDKPPHHLVLGKIGFGGVTKYLRRQLDEVESHRDMALSADFPDA